MHADKRMQYATCMQMRAAEMSQLTAGTSGVDEPGGSIARQEKRLREVVIKLGN